MNAIHKRPLNTLGYNYVAQEYLPAEADEYYLRNLQNRNGISYRNLSAYEIEMLVRNNNTSDDWNKICVSDDFNPELVKNCKFYGLVRIGKLEPVFLEYHNVCLPVGLYNSTIISCDFGDNVVVSNVNYMAHYILGNEVMIANVHELHATDHSKFGNGIIKDGEDESIRVWLEVRNENGGRRIMPFNGMLPGDAYLWSKHREDDELLEKFKVFTEERFDKRRGYYGKIGDRTVIKHTSIIKDVWIGTDAYIKGANKLKNLTINSSPEGQTQIGEGCELVNGIIGEGCRLFYGVKAVRFYMASNSQLKYGARLINSYLGNNATISCCEVLNSLIYPAHEQHHNNSFLCAALVMGQSNMAAGATIGSNHNSRAADGELIAGRGFWPGLCVSLKHNSKFASFTLLAKGDYPAELNIDIPFSLVSNNESNDTLVLMPGYWFMYNMYALARNSAKYSDRDKRIEKIQHIEYNYLAPDTINELFRGIATLERCAALAAGAAPNSSIEALQETGAAQLQQNTGETLELRGAGFENSKRPVHIVKASSAYHLFRELIVLYGVQQQCGWWGTNGINTLEGLKQQIGNTLVREEWENIGGQLVPKSGVAKLLAGIKNGTLTNWTEVHRFYKEAGANYTEQKRLHAFASLLEIKGQTIESLTEEMLAAWIEEAVATKERLTKNIHASREKDYQNPFRQMVYDNMEQMEEVVGKFSENQFIIQQEEELQAFKKDVSLLLQQLRGATV
ncbi:DUF4954 family protein [Pseudocnuella soli]|uniref:DUF4954 family protein n=1 Tax=Pseudocnuella soli TaxID=2502779 RepID=UPI00104F7358|nr:DUF4954 family protein [Pseudocnuella soli]